MTATTLWLALYTHVTASFTAQWDRQLNVFLLQAMVYRSCMFQKRTILAFQDLKCPSPVHTA